MAAGWISKSVDRQRESEGPGASPGLLPFGQHWRLARALDQANLYAEARQHGAQSAADAPQK
jgi:hypothetical protein